MGQIFASYGVLISLSILGLICVGILILLIAVASRSKPKVDESNESSADISIAAVKASFMRAVQQTESSLVSRKERHEIPWVLVLDEPDNSFDVPLEEAGCTSLISDEATRSLETPGLQWHILEQGVVVEVNTISKGSEREGVLATFLSMVQKYRPERPLDSIVVAIPCSLLESGEAGDMEELKERAQRYHRLIKSCESALGMRLAVYVVITGMENWLGANELVEEFPPALRDVMLGWSNPNDLGTQFQTNYIGPAMQDIASSFLSLVIEQSVDAGTQKNYLPKLIIAKRIRSLHPNLSQFLQELLRPNAHDEAFFFRGFYIAMGCEAHARGESTQCGFLRDLFEQKIFIERGVTRSNRVLIEQKKSRRAKVLLLAGSFATIYGLLVAFELFKRSVSIQEWITQAESLGNSLDARTAEALRLEIEETSLLINKTTDQKFWALSIPSSWPVWYEPPVDQSQASFERYLVAMTIFSLLDFDKQLATLGGDNFSTGMSSLRAIQCSKDDRLAVTQADLLTYSDDLLLALFDMRQHLSELQSLIADEDGTVSHLRLLPLVKRANLRYPDFSSQSFTSNQALDPVLDDSLIKNRSELLGKITACTIDNIAAATGRLLNERRPLLDSEINVQAQRDALINNLRSRRASKSAILNSYDDLIVALSDQNRAISQFNQTDQQLKKFAEAVQSKISEFGKNGFISKEKLNDALGSVNGRLAELSSDSPTDFDNAADTFVEFDDDGRVTSTEERLRLLSELRQVRMDPVNFALGDSNDFLAFNGLVRLDVKRLGDLVNQLREETSYDGEYLRADEDINDALMLRKVRFGVEKFLSNVRSSQVPVGKLTDQDYARFSEGANLLSQASTYLFDIEFYDAASTIDFFLAEVALEYLGHLDESFERAAPFVALASIGNTSRSTKLGMNTGGGGSALNLKKYIDKQVEFVRGLNESANLVRPYLRSGSIERWDALESGLQAFDTGDPRSGLGFLYGFTEISGGSGSIDCTKLAPSILIGGEIDPYFGSLASDLMSEAEVRCQQFDREEEQIAWVEFTDFFNDKLSGRAPFGKSKFAGMADIASINQARSLFEAFKLKLGPKFSQLEANPFIAGWSEFEKNLDQMKITDEEFGVKVETKFRSTREQERFANQLIEFELEIPSGRQSDETEIAFWRVGDPVKLRLRLAADSAFVFVDKQGLPLSQTKELNIEYDGDWSIYSMIRDTGVMTYIPRFGQLTKSSVPVMFEFFLQNPEVSANERLKGALSAELRFFSPKDASPVQFPVGEFLSPPTFVELPLPGNPLAQQVNEVDRD